MPWGKSDPSGGSCTFTPEPGGSDAFEVTVGVFPDTVESFESFLEEFTQRQGRTGRQLWTSPVEIQGIGERAFSFQSPDGGFDNVWVFVNGYRVLVTNEATTDVQGAPAQVQAVAEAAVSNI